MADTPKLRPKKKLHKTYREVGEINKINRLYDGKKGFLVSYRMRRTREAKKEITDLFNRFVFEAAEQAPVSAPAGSFDDELERELKEARRAPFAHATQIECLLFCESAGDVVAEAERLIERVAAERCVVREVQRVVPLEEVGIASSPIRVLEAVRRVLATHDLTRFSTFAVRYECRNNSSFERDAIIRDVAATVPSHLHADLKNPDVEVGIEIFGRGFGVRVVAGSLAARNRWRLVPMAVAPSPST